MLLIVNFPHNSCTFRLFLIIKLAFCYLWINPIACQFLLNNLHLSAYFTHRGQSPDRQQPIKEPSLKYYPFLLFSVSSLIRDRLLEIQQSFSFLFIVQLRGIIFFRQLTVDEWFWFLLVKGSAVSVVSFATVIWSHHATYSLSNGK